MRKVDVSNVFDKICRLLIFNCSHGVLLLSTNTSVCVVTRPLYLGLGDDDLDFFVEDVSSGVPLACPYGLYSFSEMIWVESI